MLKRLIEWFSWCYPLAPPYPPLNLDIFCSSRLSELAEYNTEVSRGIMHTEEHKEKMKALQEAYDLSSRLNAEAKGWKVI